MSDKNSLCKWKKERIEAQMDKLKDIVAKPKFICKKCGRAATTKKWLCKPINL